jgi:hypothetical protein
MFLHFIYSALFACCLHPEKIDRLLPGEKNFLFTTSCRQNLGPTADSIWDLPHRESKEIRTWSLPVNAFFVLRLRMCGIISSSPTPLWYALVQHYLYSYPISTRFQNGKRYGVSSCIHAAPALRRVKMPRNQQECAWSCSIWTSCWSRQFMFLRDTKPHLLK